MQHAKIQLAQLPNAELEQEVRIEDPLNPELNGYWRVLRIADGHAFAVKVCELDGSEESRKNWKMTIMMRAQLDSMKQAQPPVALSKMTTTGSGTVTNPEDKE